MDFQQAAEHLENRNFNALRGIDINGTRQAGTGKTLLHFAAELDDADAAAALIELGADPSALDCEDQNPLMSALAEHKFKAAKILAPLTNLAQKSDCGHTALSLAAKAANKDAAGILLRNGADPNDPSANGMPPLFLAALNASTEILRLLIDNGADLNLLDRAGLTVLHHAARLSNPELIKLLIDNGAKAAPAPDGATPAHYLFSGNHCGGADEDSKRLEILQILKNAGANFSTSDARGRTVLMDALKHNNLQCAEFLFANSTNLDAVDDQGTNVLHELIGSAYCRKREPMTEALNRTIAAGANLNQASLAERFYRDTPVHLAAGSTDTTVLEHLLSTGLFDLKTKGDKNKTIKALAKWISNNNALKAIERFEEQAKALKQRDKIAAATRKTSKTSSTPTL